MKQNIPPGWEQTAQAQWLSGQRQAAIDTLLAAINTHGRIKPKPLLLQFGYYLFLLNDWKAATRVFEDTIAQHGTDGQVLKNIAVIRNKLGDYAGAINFLHQAQALRPDDYHIQDGLAHAYAHLHHYDDARTAGTRALAMKDTAHRASSPPRARATTHAGTANIIAFSLWGDRSRYLRGALRNALLVEDIYPGWRARFYVDTSVAETFRDALAGLGAEICLMPADQPTGDKLTWRFRVANDPDVDRFLVRDCDSVINPREANAVAAWIASAKSFHVMRDWWTHTDLMLAGMWGGKAGILPDLAALWRDYTPGLMPTDNVDQWFLRDRVWPLIRADVLAHDRCFRMAGSVPFPDTDPPGQAHVGQNEYATARALQTRLLRPWIDMLPELSS